MRKDGVKVMEKYIYDESGGVWYELQGNCYIPTARKIRSTPTRLF